MKNAQPLLGQLILEITSADITALLNTFSDAKIRLQNITYCNDLVLRVTISVQDYRKLLTIADKQGASIKVLGRIGAYWLGISILRRPVLLLLFALLLTLVCFIPSRIFFISVEGNNAIPDNYILEAAQECGLSFGISRREIRSETLKNALLQKIPQLQWAGVNTSGCTAVISVREKTAAEETHNKENKVSSIVALRDGVIRNCTVYQGNPLCTVGQAVKAGQTLVSGYLDYGNVIKATRASAEIKALTFRQLELVAPTPTAMRGACSQKKTCYSLKIGKKVINLFKDSGNLETTCVKIYSENYLCLPGGFRLPVAIIKQTQFYYEDVELSTAASDSGEWLTASAQSYLLDTMIAGEVISAQTDIDHREDACYLYGKYACIEMIGQEKNEQTMLKGGENE